MSQKLLVNNLEWSEYTSLFNEDFIKTYNEESDEGYFLEFDVQYPEKLDELYNNLSFLLERMKIEKVEKLVGALHDKSHTHKKLSIKKKSIKLCISFLKIT